MSIRTLQSLVKSKNTQPSGSPDSSDTDEEEGQASSLFCPPQRQNSSTSSPDRIAAERLVSVAARFQRRSRAPGSTADSPESLPAVAEWTTQQKGALSAGGGRRRKTPAEVKQIFDPLHTEPLAFGKRLGSGAFGDVYRGRLTSGRVVAIKQVVEDPSAIRSEAEMYMLLTPGTHEWAWALGPVGHRACT